MDVACTVSEYKSALIESFNCWLGRVFTEHHRSATQDKANFILILKHIPEVSAEGKSFSGC